MKKWEVNRVNALFKEIDALKEENAKLKEIASLSALEQRLDSIESKVDQICKCCDCDFFLNDTETTKKTK